MKIDYISKETINGAQLILDTQYKIAPSCFIEAKNEKGHFRYVVDFYETALASQ